MYEMRRGYLGVLRKIGYDRNARLILIRSVSTLLLVMIILAGLSMRSVQAQSLLVPMDREQQNHLRAYGLAYWTLEQEEKAELSLIHI